MIDLTKQTVEQVTENFKKAQIEGTGPLVPRNGFYYVRTFEYRNVMNRADVPIITANWKPNRTELFLEEALFEIAVSSLQLSYGSQKIDFATIVGRVVQIYDVGLSKEMINGKEKQIVTGKWMYEIAKPVFFKQISLLDAFAKISESMTLVDMKIDGDYVEDLDECSYIEDPWEENEADLG